MAKIILPSNYEKQLKEASMEAGRDLARVRIKQIAQQYYEKMPLVKEWWIRIIGKRDLYSNKINAVVSAADRNNRHKIDTPVQGAQMWYVNMNTNEVRLEWILPFTAAKRADNKKLATNDNPIIEQSFDKAAKALGRDLITGKPVKVKR